MIWSMPDIKSKQQIISVVKNKFVLHQNPGHLKISALSFQLLFSESMIIKNTITWGHNWGEQKFSPSEYLNPENLHSSTARYYSIWYSATKNICSLFTTGNLILQCGTYSCMGWSYTNQLKYLCISQIKLKLTPQNNAHKNMVGLKYASIMYGVKINAQWYPVPFIPLEKINKIKTILFNSINIHNYTLNFPVH